MKKNMLISVAALAGLAITTWSFSSAKANFGEPETPCKTNYLADNAPLKDTVTYSDFFYNAGTRYKALRKSDLNRAVAITDIINDERVDHSSNYKEVSVILIENDDHSEIRESGQSEMLTAKQKELLNSLEYSSSFLVRADYDLKSQPKDKWDHDYFSPYYTVVPEKQAEYIYDEKVILFSKPMNGMDALVQFLADKNKENIRNLDEDKLKSAKLSFTVTRMGTIADIKLDHTCGYPAIDKRMLELIGQAPGYWVPAENEKGEKVDQELVVSFGIMGC